MVFWKNVKNEIDFRGISRKELAAKSNVPKYTIDKGIERNSEVMAMVALKIAKALDVSVEYLITGEIYEKPENLNTLPNSYSSEAQVILSRIGSLSPEIYSLLKKISSLPPKKEKSL